METLKVDDFCIRMYSKLKILDSNSTRGALAQTIVGLQEEGAARDSSRNQNRRNKIR